MANTMLFYEQCLILIEVMRFFLRISYQPPYLAIALVLKLCL